tara:strand:+ start:772 stop:1257 length:486 start_codon:yes stop_codon:yes gene_type:complete
MYLLFFIINLLLYIIFLKLFLVLFGSKYIFPVRVADLFNLITNLIINFAISFYYLNFSVAFNVILINFFLFFIFYSILSMISTSPRTKILLDVHKAKYLNKKDYLKKRYNTKIILDNRIKRLLTNNEIIFIKNKKIILNQNKKGLNFLPFVSFMFELMKKI